jgi:hypothetical protein
LTRKQGGFGGDRSGQGGGANCVVNGNRVAKGGYQGVIDTGGIGGTTVEFNQGLIIGLAFGFSSGGIFTSLSFIWGKRQLSYRERIETGKLPTGKFHPFGTGGDDNGLESASKDRN